MQEYIQIILLLIFHFETTKYNIKYETNGGTLYTDDDEQGRAAELDNSVYEAGTKLSDLPVKARQARHFGMVL